MTTWERLVEARLLDRFEKLLPAYAGTNGCDNLQSKQLFSGRVGEVQSGECKHRQQLSARWMGLMDYKLKLINTLGKLLCLLLVCGCSHL